MLELRSLLALFLGSTAITNGAGISIGTHLIQHAKSSESTDNVCKAGAVAWITRRLISIALMTKSYERSRTRASFK